MPMLLVSGKMERIRDATACNFQQCTTGWFAAADMSQVCHHKNDFGCLDDIVFVIQLIF